MVQTTLQTISVGEYVAAYQEQGTGPVIIFLHGFLGDVHTWDLLIEPLAPHFRCIALDLLGFGQSSKPRLKYTIWHQVEFLHQFIQTMGLEDVALVGHSYGGWVAVAYGLTAAGLGWTVDKTAWVLPLEGDRPQGELPIYHRPRALTLLAPAGIRDDQFVGRYTYMQPLLWQTPVVDWAIAALGPVMALAQRQTQYREIRRARRALKAQPVAKSFLIDRLKPEDAIDTVERFLPHLSVPTLIFAGQQDTTIPFWHCETYARRLPNSQLIPFPEAEHDLPQAHGGAISTDLIQHWMPQGCPTA
ncbi:alpha/beta fold hydrolase [Leptolyngbya sp. PCC 6406]|uniref:alpha/beta fold hydrolase n=1 Tax=Leptolyngbya sp. PCC 6406 TaxID=1173264 RepID=UPI0002ABC851|nr:alpha/beta hydrolase [Leptolyngbya sp. PCC 6406]